MSRIDPSRTDSTFVSERSRIPLDVTGAASRSAGGCAINVAPSGTCASAANGDGKAHSQQWSCVSSKKSKRLNALGAAQMGQALLRALKESPLHERNRVIQKSGRKLQVVSAILQMRGSGNSRGNIRVAGAASPRP